MKKSQELWKSIFDLDSPWLRWFTLVFDMLCLNALFLVTCLPLLTIGPARMALYQTMKAVKEGRKPSILAYYIQQFKQHLSLGWRLNVIDAGLLVVLVVDILLTNRGNALPLQVIRLVSYALLFILYLWGLYAYPMASKYHMTTKEVVWKAFLLVGVHLPQTMMFLLVGLALFFLASWSPVSFLLMLSSFVIIGCSLMAYLQVSLLEAVFVQYS